MSDPTLEALFWEEIDGPPSAARREQIESLVRERPQAARELEALRRLAGELEAAAEVEPPAELRAEIRRQVASRAALRSEAGPAGAGWLRSLLAGGWRPRLALAAAAALVALVGFQLVSGGRSTVSDHDRSRLSGALNVGGGAGPAPYEVALADSAGAVRFSSREATLVVDLRPAGGRTLELWLAGNGRALELLQVEGSGRAQGETGDLGGTVRLVADGPVSAVLRVAGDDWSGVTVRVLTMAGETLLDERLEPARLGYGASSSPTSDSIPGIQQ